ncbi:xaa-Pro dipeptidase [Pelomyxa schiedti]|nr:xaa-Pro dipeptidase [Pelomyxa schiedti]KAH3761520.1 xaa-Pro dipeptidase [Pelomyxa schiedti]
MAATPVVHWMGQATLKVGTDLHKQNRVKLMGRFRDAANPCPVKSLLFVKGGDDTAINDSDIDYTFKQESTFQYLFGVRDPGCMGIIDMASSKSILFMSRPNPAYQAILGKIQPPSFYVARYGVDEVKYVDEIPAFVAEYDPDIIYTMHGVNTDSGIVVAEATFSGIAKYHVDKGRLFREVYECRLTKTPAEIEVMRYVVKASAEAHKAVMKSCAPGMMEYQLESLFLHHMYFNSGCRHSGYTPICGSGPNSAVLHYGHAGAPNDRQMQDGDLVLVDMGAEYHCYDGDITCTFPVNGRFTADQRDVYETVLAANRAVEENMRPGVSWPDMHKLANRVICEQLKQRGFLKGDVDEMMKVHIGALFMPHGLGHLLGLDTHDVGGYPRGTTRSTAPGESRLRCARPLVPGMILTVEPGVYFNSFLLEPAFENPDQAKFLVKEKLVAFMNFGGVRIEDDVLVTETGCEILSCGLPRTPAEIEAFMSKS